MYFSKQDLIDFVDNISNSKYFKLDERKHVNDIKEKIQNGLNIDFAYYELNKDNKDDDGLIKDNIWNLKTFSAVPLTNNIYCNDEFAIDLQRYDSRVIEMIQQKLKAKAMEKEQFNEIEKTIKEEEE